MKPLLVSALIGLTVAAAPAWAYGPSNPLVCKQGEQKALIAYTRINSPLIDNVYICDAPQALRSEAGLQALKDAIGGTALPGSSIKIVSIILLDN
jgi:hypothetical protein